MDHVREIQEIIDEHKEQMPTGVVVDIGKRCQKAYNAMSNLYKLNWTVVYSHAHVVDVEDEPSFAKVELSYRLQTLIVEAVDPGTASTMKLSFGDMPNHGMVTKSWLGIPTPFVTGNYGTNMTIIHSIVPYNL
jgi:hypothetical protein